MRRGGNALTALAFALVGVAALTGWLFNSDMQKQGRWPIVTPTAPAHGWGHDRGALLAVLMQASYTGWLFMLYPATSPEQGLVWQTAFAVALWVVVAVVVASTAHR